MMMQQYLQYDPYNDKRKLVISPKTKKKYVIKNPKPR